MTGPISIISKPGSEKIKIIQISDLHIDQLKPFHRAITKKINILKPDLIFFTGDSVNETKKIDILDSFLKLINKSIKKFAVTGNWEYTGNVDINRLKTVYARYNCELLINENRKVTLKNRDIAIIGMDDLNEGRPNLKKAVKNIQKADTTIMLSHCPEYRDLIYEAAGNITIDLILSGHTHGGQVTILGFAPLKPRGSGKYLKGWYNDDGPKMYISKGLGTTLLPFRIGPSAEMVEIEL